MTDADQRTAFDSTREAAVADKGYDRHGREEHPVPVTALDYGDEARPVGWSRAVDVVGVEELDADHVQVMWEGPNAPGPVTPFRKDEWVLSTRPHDERAGTG